MVQKHPITTVRHTLAHIMAAAVQQIFPDAKFGIGPVVENGFYYDFELDHQLTEEGFPEIEKKMRAIIAKHVPIEHLHWPVKDAVAEMKKQNQPYKVELLEEIASGNRPAIAADDLAQEKNGNISFYKIGDFVDLCRGPHVNGTEDISGIAFKLDRIAGAYWRGDEKRPQLQRLYALAFASQKELDQHLTMLEEAKKRDHKKLGPELDLFVFSDLIGSGLPLWTPRGTLVRNLLDDFVWQLRQAHGYMQVDIPHITKKDLYEKSGHWEKFKDDLFKINTREGHVFVIKPMNCPHHTQIYARKQWSYRELPQRYANTTKVYRDEQSGELAGLSRVRAITQDDAHVFCRADQAKEEFLKVWDIVHEFYGTFGFGMRVRLSLHDPAHPEKYLGDPQRWAQAEAMLREIAQEKNADTFDGVGEANFYGPKLDFMAKDAIGREWQVATIQLDMNMPERFDLTCINEKGEKERVVMIHAAIMGSIERFMSVLIEHTAGAFPAWLAPIQVAILPISEKQNEYAQKVATQLRKDSIRTEVHDHNETIGKKIRGAEMQKIPYLLVVGDKEIAAESVAVRERGKGDIGAVKIAEFIEKLQGQIKNRS